MFLRVVRAAGGKGVKHEYVRVVEAFRQNGKTRHRTVLNLGRRDLLAAHLDLDKLKRLLHGEAVADRAIRREDVCAVAAWDWGPMLVAGQLWRELGLEATLDRLATPTRRDAATLSDRALVLVVNRLTAPGSEHRLARWLETDFVCDRHGRRWLPEWRDDGERIASRTPRVGWRCVSSRGGTARSINCWSAKSRSSTRSLSRCATCSRSRSTWCSMISPRPISRD